MQCHWLGRFNTTPAIVTDFVLIENTSFNNHDNGVWKQKGYWTSGAVYLGNFFHKAFFTFSFNKLHFENNTITVFGAGCMSVYTNIEYGIESTVNETMIDTIVLRNTKQTKHVKNQTTMITYQEEQFK